MSHQRRDVVTKARATFDLPESLLRFAQHWKVDNKTTMNAIAEEAFFEWATKRGYREDEERGETHNATSH